MPCSAVVQYPGSKPVLDVEEHSVVFGQVFFQKRAVRCLMFRRLAVSADDSMNGEMIREIRSIVLPWRQVNNRTPMLGQMVITSHIPASTSNLHCNIQQP
jgi:hypothetical protein